MQCFDMIKKVSTLKSLQFCLAFHLYRGIIVSFTVDEIHFRAEKYKEILFEGLVVFYSVFLRFILVAT